MSSPCVARHAPVSQTEPTATVCQRNLNGSLSPGLTSIGSPFQSRTWSTEAALEEEEEEEEEGTPPPPSLGAAPDDGFLGSAAAAAAFRLLRTSSSLTFACIAAEEIEEAGGAV